MTIRVLVADDQDLSREGLARIINSHPDLDTVATAADGRQALELARLNRPDVCVLDVRMPRLTGLEVTRQLLSEPSPPAIVIVTTFDLDEYLYEALACGAAGFVLKDAPATVLIEAVLAANNGDRLISPELTDRLVRAYLRHPPRDHANAVQLTPREQDVLALVAQGCTNQEIAETLHVSLSTTKGHMSTLMAKTGTSSRVKLVIWAIHNGQR